MSTDARVAGGPRAGLLTGTIDPVGPVTPVIILRDGGGHAPDDLAPQIHRQRLVVEGTCRAPIGADEISAYLAGLSEVCGMRALIEPVTHRSDKYGWAGWIHWETSGAHFYAWEEPTLFFSVDIYACKAFEPAFVMAFTREFLDPVDLVAFSF